MRTTRRVRATEAGRFFYDRCAVILRDAESAFAEISRSAAVPTGTLTITAPVDYGAAAVAPPSRSSWSAIPICGSRRPSMTMSPTSWRSRSMSRSASAGSTIPAIRRSNSGTFAQHLVCSPAFARRLPPRLDPKTVEGLPWIANNALKTPLRWLFSRASGRRRPSRRAGVGLGRQDADGARLRSRRRGGLGASGFPGRGRHRGGPPRPPPARLDPAGRRHPCRLSGRPFPAGQGQACSSTS